MNRRKTLLAVLLCAGALLAAVPALALDTIQYMAGDKAQEHKGTIVKDDYTGVTIVTGGGARFTIPRNQIIKPIYGDANNRAFDAALTSYQEGRYKLCLQQLDAAWAGIPRMPAAQRPLFSQYVRYYRGLCHYRMGLESGEEKERREAWKAARDELTTLIAKVPDTAFYFDAKLKDAQCLEAFSPTQAEERYKFLVEDFQKKMKEAKASMGWAQKYVFLAEMGRIRLEMASLTDKRGSETKVKGLLQELKSLQKSAFWRKYSDADNRIAATKIEAMALSYLKEYTKLVDILNTVIRDAQRIDDAEALGELYLRRGDTYFHLAEEAGSDAQKNEFREGALYDYLRADLLFPLKPETKGRVNLQAAKIFVELKTADWKKRASQHLREAKKNGIPGNEVLAVEQSM